MSILVFATLGGLLGMLLWLIGGEALRRARVSRDAARLVESDRRSAAARSSAEGGSPETAIVVPTPAIIDDRAKRTPCSRCSRDVGIRAHRATVVDGARLRAVDVECRWCGHVDTLWFRLAPDVSAVLH